MRAPSAPGLWLVVASACATASPPPTKRVVIVTAPGAPVEDPSPPSQSTACIPAPRRPTARSTPRSLPPNPDDPRLGRFDIRDAIQGLRGSWPLIARIETSEGDLSCTLWDEVAPLTVANFVGLARGLRPFRDPATGLWLTRPAYEGTTFHRVIRGFMLQGGDPSGNGTGDPGYNLPDELDERIQSDHRGVLYMANRGPDTNGMQFFILDAPAPHIAGRYSAFGECEPDEVIERIASVPTGAGDRPRTPVEIRRVQIAFKEPCRSP